MEKFCANCGHANNQSNRNCIECGTPFTHEEKTIKSDIKKPALPFKKKLMIGAVCVLIAAFAGLYSWGTKTASAESAISKFFEALQNEDAAALKKYIVLSNGDELTEKEATAFIKLYEDITPRELEAMATVEKNGKVAGIFNAHKIVFSPQKVSISFPFEGLKLKLNGETVKGSQNGDGDYVFSGIAPGLHKGEFSYSGEYTEFSHPFDLWVDQQEDSSYVHSIPEELPVNPVIISTSVNGMVPNAKSKVFLNGKEIPVGKEGATEEVGPVSMDGSVEAHAEIELPWGTLKSDMIPVTESYLDIDIQDIPTELKELLGKRVALFAEEDTQANGTLNAANFTTVTKSKLQEIKQNINDWKEYDYFYKWSLLEVTYDEDSFYLLENGETVSLDAEFVVKSDYYSGSNGSDGVETLQYRMTLEYDQESSEWLVDTAEYYGSSYVFDSPKTIEGSKKVYKTTKSSNVNEEDASNPADQRDEIEGFMSAYNSDSVAAINNGDFSIVSDFLMESGPRYQQQLNFIEDMYSKGITEEHLSTSLENVEALNDGMWQVTTIEYFIIHGTEKSTEKKYRTITNINISDEWLIDELISTTEI